jgi:DNA gyrase subunit B
MVRSDAASCNLCQSDLTAKPRQDADAWEWLAQVRARPAMYIGSIGQRGVIHLVWELVNNSAYEAALGYCKNVIVTLNPDDSVSISDDGRGISCDRLLEADKTFLETAMTSLLGSGKFLPGGYTAADALHSIGLAVVNALSERLEVEVCRDGKIYRQAYGKGKPKAELQVVGSTEGHGTSITIWPDRDIFYDLDASKHLKRIRFDWDLLTLRLKEIASLNKGLVITVTDKRLENAQGASQQFCFRQGIISCLEHLNMQRNALNKPPVYFERRRGNIFIECALQWTDATDKIVQSFANSVNTASGGSHLNGFYNGLTRVFNDYGKKHGLIDDQATCLLDKNDVTEGLTAIISVKAPHSQFKGEKKDCLTNGEVEKFMEQMVYKAMFDWLEFNREMAKELLTKAIAARSVREQKQTG